MSYYDILGVSATANQQEIKRAYRQKALLYHPDRNVDMASNEQFHLVYIAYEVLHDPLKRSIYDLLQQAKEQCRQEEIENENNASAADRDYARRRREYEERERRRKEFYESQVQGNEQNSQETYVMADDAVSEEDFSSRIEFHSKQGIGLFFCFILLCIGFTSLLFGYLFVIWEQFSGAILLGCTFWAVGITIAVVAGKGLMAVFQTWKA